MKLKVQVVFNNQKWGNELEQLSALGQHILARSSGKIELEFLPSRYSIFKQISFGVFFHPFNPGEVSKQIDNRWYIENVYPIAPPEADVIMFICARADWDGAYQGGYTYGHCQYSRDFPIMIEMMVEPGDKSWKYPQQDALVHYGTHELAHGLEMNGHDENIDRTHELDYRDENGINQLFSSLDYNKLGVQLKYKKGYSMGGGVVYKQRGQNDLYFLNGQTLVPFSGEYEVFLKDFKDCKEITLEPDEFIKLRSANFNVVKPR